MLHLWRADELAFANLERFCQASREAADLDFVILDKTATGLGRDLVGRPRPNLSVTRRPHDEDYWVSHSTLPWSRWTWATIAHDDDSWHGLPIPPPGARTTHACLPSAGPHVPKEKKYPHIAIYHGAIRTRIYQNYCDFASMAPSQFYTSDNTLAAWIRHLGLGPMLPNFEYIYDDRNWSSWETSKIAYEKAAESLGWGSYSSVEAMRWTSYLDLLCSLNYFNRIATHQQWFTFATDCLDRYPPFGFSPWRRVLRSLPTSARALHVRSRGAGVFRYLNIREDPRITSQDVIWKYLLAGPQHNTNSVFEAMKFVSHVDEQLNYRVDFHSSELKKRTEWWMSQLEELQCKLVQGSID